MNVKIAIRLPILVPSAAQRVLFCIPLLIAPVKEETRTR